MKEKYIFLIIILSAFTFISCDKENTALSCVSVDKVDKTFPPKMLKVNEANEIEFEILNECDANYTIFDYEISGDIKNIKIEGLTKNKLITSKNLTFKVIVFPITTGYETIGFFIRTDIGQMAVSAGIDVNY
ncbi:hypothetical protein [Polaribacter sp. SA4-12]|uniref:hypothetical protein n=1 Tax=Polaribacter sp. SA4-12 TaxID=1312072 RepID=UPI000B3D3B25|nr:hypothetical protein [Polaribacter sp. SA4-12]ARV14268.1 hypothetical protein BTO07_03480 [Polaribacter sp. SA4-12]